MPAPRKKWSKNQFDFAIPSGAGEWRQRRWLGSVPTYCACAYRVYAVYKMALPDYCTVAQSLLEWTSHVEFNGGEEQTAAWRGCTASTSDRAQWWGRRTSDSSRTESVSTNTGHRSEAGLDKSRCSTCSWTNRLSYDYVALIMKWMASLDGNVIRRMFFLVSPLNYKLWHNHKSFLIHVYL